MEYKQNKAICENAQCLFMFSDKRLKLGNTTILTRRTYRVVQQALRTLNK